MTSVERETSTARLAAGAVEYRLEGDDPQTVVIFQGGHLRAGLALGEEVFTASGYRVLILSRPGYGRTPLATAPTAAAFADVTADLCRTLGIEQVAATIPRAELVESRADGHMIWFAPDYPAIIGKIKDFLATA